MTDQIKSYEDDLREFFQNRQGLSPDTKHGAWHSFQLWRIAEALEALADTEITRGIIESDDDEPWRKGDDDD